VMSEQLEKRFAEAPVALGLTGGGRMVVQVFASADGATWTVVLTSPARCSPPGSTAGPATGTSTTRPPG
jgi:hypothetical protein